MAADGRLVQIGVRTELGKALLRQFGPDSEFWDTRQCVLERKGGRQWVLSPVPGTTNETLLNGEAITAPRVLRQGDRPPAQGHQQNCPDGARTLNRWRTTP